ncbi:MAG: hypothetical protein Q7K35_02755 [bacterium]|nr:hypothetical protein [bacterium]
MKKILLFFSAVFFVFIMASSAQAAIDVTVTFPADGELNYQTTKSITWTYPAGNLIAPKFNISMFTGAETRPIATQVLCRAAADGSCAYSWKVGKITSGRFLMGVNYKIKVCLAVVGESLDCDESADFKIIPSAITTQQQVFNLFKTAMGNRYNNLNAYNPTVQNYYTGEAGVRDFLTVNTAATGFPTYRISTTTVNAVDTVTNTNKKIYAMTLFEQLDWFKYKFNQLKGDFLNARDRDGIKYAMSNRYSDLCAAPWNTAKDIATRAYNTAVADAEKARKGARAKFAADGTVIAGQEATGQELCNFNYNRDMKITTIVPAKNSDYNNATLRFIALQKLQNAKDLCLTAEYKKLYDAKETALGTTGISGFEDAMVAPTNAYGTCLGDRKSNWW